LRKKRFDFIPGDGLGVIVHHAVTQLLSVYRLLALHVSDFRRASALLTTLNLCPQLKRPYIQLIRMSLSQNIRARIELPCSIRFLATGLGSTRGLTEELSRESLVVIAFPAIPVDRLSKSAHIAVAIELPHAREFRPRLLECAATVSGVHLVESGLRITAKVNRMSIKDREPEYSAKGKFAADKYGLQPIAVTEGSRNANRVVPQSHLTSKTQGEYSMSILKKLFVEEDGQDMVEYGLVIALVVLAAAAAVSVFGGKVSTGFTALGTSVSTSL
jgi:pilus assembly protein Flp/PilA